MGSISPRAFQIFLLVGGVLVLLIFGVGHVLTRTSKTTAIVDQQSLVATSSKEILLSPKEIELQNNPPTTSTQTVLNSQASTTKNVPPLDSQEVVETPVIEKFYFAVIESGELVYPVEQGSYNYPLPHFVTIYKYDTNEKKLTKAFGPYPSEAKYLEGDETPRIRISNNRKNMLFSDMFVLSFRGGIKNFDIISPHKGLITENTESPVLSPDGKKIVYSVGNAIKMFDTQTGAYTDLIKDTSPLGKNIGKFDGDVVYPVYWFTQNGDSQILLEVRTRNQNSIPWQISGYYIYVLETNTYSTTTFEYALGKKIQHCDIEGTVCIQSPSITSRSPDGRFELINGGRELLDYSVLSTDSKFDVRFPISILKPTFCDTMTWSHDGQKILCSGSEKISSAERDLFIQSVSNGKAISLAHKYAVIDISTRKTSPSSVTTNVIQIPQNIRDAALSQIEEFEAKLAERNILKGSKEYEQYADGELWQIYYYLIQSQVNNTVGWLGNGKYFVVKQNSDAPGYREITKQTALLLDSSGKEHLLGEYSINPAEKIEGKAIIEKFRSVSFMDEATTNLQKEIDQGTQVYMRMKKVDIKYLGGVSP